MNETGVLEDRSEAQILEAAPKVVTLGGRQYEIRPRKGRKHTRAIRAKLGDILPSADTISEFVAGAASDDVMKMDGAAIEKLVPLIVKLIGPAFDDMLDIVYEYEPTIDADREWLEENASDVEFVTALVAIIGMTYGPFVAAIGLNVTTNAKTPQDGSN